MARTSIQNANASLYLPTGSYSSSTAIAGLSAGFTFGCWFRITTINAVCRIMSNSEAGSTISTMGINGTGGNTALRAGYYNGSSYIGARSSSMLSPGQWYHGVYTFDGTNGNIYINGVLDNASTNSPSGSSTTSLRIGDAVNGVRGNVSKAVVYNRAVTAEEVASIYAGNIPTSGLQANYPLSEGAGSIAYDTSGNGNNGTITSPTWTRDAPSKTRTGVNGNLVYNGDFEIAPVVNVATTSGGVYVDGTAAGDSSGRQTIFGWFVWNYTTSWEAKFDTSVKRSGNASIKISTKATGSSIGLRASIHASATFKQNNIPVLPNTSYTASGWIKTNLVSGSAATGARLQFVTSTGANDVTTVNLATGLVATQDWTYYTSTFTTAATARFVTPVLQIVGSDGTGTLIMDMWVDDITLTPTTDTTRTATSGPYRKTVENLVANGDFEYAPAFTAATTTNARFIDGSAAGSASNLYGYRTSFVNSCSAQFDTTEKYSGNSSMKVSTVGANAVSQIVTIVTPSVSSTEYYSLLPSTAYTITFMMKTSKISGGGRGAFLRHTQYSGDKTSGTGTDSTYINTTTGWTSYTISFTTASTARFGQIKLFVYGQESTVDLIMDAWFDDIVLTKTTPNARTVA